jgi:hypothetical protein
LSRQDIGEFNGVPYLKDLKLVGRLFRSHDTDVRESELVVFIMPEIISYDEPPNCRESLIVETINCRMAQIPEAEGCQPCCRRLPPEAYSEPLPVHSETVPADAAPADVVPATEPPLPPQQPEALEPMAASGIHSAEFQFGVAGRSRELQTMVAEGRLRRLPNVGRNDVSMAVASGTPVSPSIFPAPAAENLSPAPATDGQIRAAERTRSGSTVR